MGWEPEAAINKKGLAGAAQPGLLPCIRPTLVIPDRLPSGAHLLLSPLQAQPVLGHLQPAHSHAACDKSRGACRVGESAAVHMHRPGTNIRRMRCRLDSVLRHAGHFNRFMPSKHSRRTCVHGLRWPKRHSVLLKEANGPWRAGHVGACRQERKGESCLRHVLVPPASSLAGEHC